MAFAGPPVMDMPLDTATRWKSFARRAALPVCGVLASVALLALLPGWVTPSVDRDRMRTARVELGPLEATVTASGTVVPEFEKVISSPISSRVLRIVEKAGAEVSPGQPIVELDLRESVVRVERIDEDIALKRNRHDQLGIDLQRRLDELETRRRLQVLTLESLADKTEQSRELVALGASSQEHLRDAKLAEERARIELAQIEDQMDNSRASTRVQQEALDLEMRSLERDRQEASRQLDLARIEADREGVLTWVVEREGIAVGQGEEIARLADLSSFRVEATISDVHAQRLRVGLPVKVRASEETYYAGRISRVLPTVENGALTLDVTLEDAAHSALRPNQRVDVYLIIAHRDEVLKLARGSYLSGGAGRRQVFVVRGDKAVRTDVRIGISSFEACEIMAGLQEGDEVVVSDMSEYMHRQEVDIR